MSFYERFEMLCKDKGLRPQSDEIIEMTGVSSPAITGWKKGSAPKADALIRIATYFNVSIDYLLEKTDQKEKPSGDKTERLSDMHREIMERLSTLSPEKLREAESYIDFLLAQQEKDNQ